jgi:hypothetical protein
MRYENTLLQSNNASRKDSPVKKLIPSNDLSKDSNILSRSQASLKLLIEDEKGKKKRPNSSEVSKKLQ